MNVDKLKIVEYLREGKSPFRRWFNALDAVPAAKITTALYRLEAGNFPNVKPVGMGVMKYRIYFGRDGKKLIILLGGGSKKTQGKEIIAARSAWKQYKADKRSKSV